MAVGDDFTAEVVLTHAPRWGHSYGPSDVAIYRITSDPDFAKFDPDAQERILARLLGDWYPGRED